LKAERNLRFGLFFYHQEHEVGTKDTKLALEEPASELNKPLLASDDSILVPFVNLSQRLIRALRVLFLFFLL
jgi:hypothetical protein